MKEVEGYSFIAICPARGDFSFLQGEQFHTCVFRVFSYRIDVARKRRAKRGRVGHLRKRPSIGLIPECSPRKKKGKSARKSKEILPMGIPFEGRPRSALYGTWIRGTARPTSQGSRKLTPVDDDVRSIASCRGCPSPNPNKKDRNNTRSALFNRTPILSPFVVSPGAFRSGLFVCLFFKFNDRICRGYPIIYPEKEVPRYGRKRT